MGRRKAAHLMLLTTFSLTTFRSVQLRWLGLLCGLCALKTLARLGTITKVVHARELLRDTYVRVTNLV